MCSPVLHRRHTLVSLVHGRSCTSASASSPGRHSSRRGALQVEHLAHHAFRGEVWGKAVTYFRQAGLKASARSAYREAIACFEQALEALKRIPEGRDTREEAIDLRLDLRNSLLPLGKIGRILNALLEAETLAEGLEDQHRLGWISSFIAQATWQRGNHDQALASARRALAIAETLRDFALQVMANMYLGFVSSTRGDYRQGVEFLRRNVVALEGDLLRERLGTAAPPSILSRSYLVLCLAELGEFTEGTTRGEEALQIAEAIDHPYSRALAYRSLGILYLRQGDFQKAIPALERCLELCEVWRLLLLFPSVASLLGSAYAHAGRISEALPLLDQAVEQTPGRGSCSWWMTNLGEAHWLAGRSEDATAPARRALEAAREMKERGNEAYALHLLGEIAAHGDPPAAGSAGAHYRQALALADELGMRPLVAHCHLGLGSLHRHTGDWEQAQKHLSTATTMFREMDMQFWLEKAEAEMTQLG